MVALAALVLALVLAAMAFIVGRITATAPRPPRTVSVLATTTDLAPGTPITPSDLTTVTIPARDNKDHAWLPAGQAESVQGSCATTELPKGGLLGSS